MNKYGFIRVASIVPVLKLGNIGANTKTIISHIVECAEDNVSIAVFPELAITGYTMGDLFHNTKILDDSIDALLQIVSATKDYDIISIVGLPVMYENALYNCASVIYKGEILGIVPKSSVPNFGEFYELRWFRSGENVINGKLVLDKYEIPFGSKMVFENINDKKFSFGVEICEDLWTPVPPSSIMAVNGANLLFNLSASNSLVGKKSYRENLISNQSARCIAGYIYSSSGIFESTKDTVFGGYSYIYENGSLLAEGKTFSTDSTRITADIDLEKLAIERSKWNTMSTNVTFKCQKIQFDYPTKDFDIKRTYSKHPFVPHNTNELKERCEEILSIQASALAVRLHSIPGINAVIGLSGGLDSTLALLVTIRAFKLLKRDLSGLFAFTLPGFGTSERTLKNVYRLQEFFSFSLDEISMTDISNLMMNKTGLDTDDRSTVYENIQARSRTFMLMTKANQLNGIVIGTGDLSEIALGWSTYNADHISMYNVNSGVPKTLIKFLIEYYGNESNNNDLKTVLEDILEMPISPELLPPDKNEISQKTEEIIGPYELHDFFLYYFVRFGFSYEKLLFISNRTFSDKYSNAEIEKWLKTFLRRFVTSQWKRDCFTAGPRVGSVDLSPRSYWRMPTELERDIFIQTEK